MTKDHSREEIRKILAIREREGLSYEEMAARVGVSRRTLSWWSWRERRETREGDGADPARRFAELIPEVATAGDRIELVTPTGVTIRLPSSADDATLERLLSMLEQRC